MVTVVSNQVYIYEGPLLNLLSIEIDILDSLDSAGEVTFNDTDGTLGYGSSTSVEIGGSTETMTFLGAGTASTLGSLLGGLLGSYDVVYFSVPSSSGTTTYIYAPDGLPSVLGLATATTFTNTELSYDLPTSTPGIVDGTDGDDIMPVGYQDPDGDFITNTGALYPVLGPSGNDEIYGYGGNDSISAGSGADTIDGGTGNDTIFGGFGNDIIYGGEGVDDLNGEAGNDVIDAGSGAGFVSGGTGNDTISVTGGTTANLIDGGDGNDVITITDVDARANATAKGFVVGGDGSDIINIEDSTIETIYGSNIFGATTGGSGTDIFNVSGTSSVGWIWTGYAPSTNFGTEQINISDTSSVEQVEVTTDSQTVNINVGDNAQLGASDKSLTIGTWAGSQNITVSQNASVSSNTAISMGSGNDSVSFSDNASLNADILMGSGNDTIIFSDDAVTSGYIAGGAGNDVVVGGISDDEITGGTGNDSLTGGAGNDTFYYSVGDGLDTITDFNVGIPSADVGDGDATNNDYIELSAFYDDIEEIRADFDDDGILNQSNSGTVDYSDNTAFGAGQGIRFTNVTRNSFTKDGTGVVCFTRGTMIETQMGQVAIEDLETGDLVRTMDHGFSPIRWIGNRQLDIVDLTQHPKLLPIRIKAGTLGTGVPTQDLVVSPQHRVLVRSIVAERMFGEREVLVPAIKLLGVDGIDVVEDATEVQYFHMLFDQHEIVFSNGAAAESLLTGSEALKAIGAKAREEIALLFPDITEPDFTPSPVRFIPKGMQTKKLAERHQKNNKPLFEI